MRVGGIAQPHDLRGVEVKVARDFVGAATNEGFVEHNAERVNVDASVHLVGRQRELLGGHVRGRADECAHDRFGGGSFGPKIFDHAMFRHAAFGHAMFRHAAFGPKVFTHGGFAAIDGVETGQSSDAEVDDAGMTVGADQQIRGLEVAVDDAAVVAMLETVADLGELARNLLRLIR